MGKHAHWFVSAALIAASLIIGLLTRETSPTLAPILKQEVTIGAGKELSVSFDAKAHVTYLVMLTGETDENEQALKDGYIKIVNEGDIIPSLETHDSDMDDRPANFITPDQDTTVKVLVGSDIKDKGGIATLNVYDAAKLTTPIAFLEADKHSDGPGEAETSICVKRVGDVSQSFDYPIVVPHHNEEPLIVSMRSGDNYECALLPQDAAATGKASFAKNEMLEESRANAKLLGLPVEVDLSQAAAH